MTLGPHNELGPGTVLKEKWRLDTLLARSATSQVYAATHRNSRRFAIKIFDERAVADPERRARLVERCFLANGVPHAGAIHVLDDDETDGRVFLVMDLVDGETLHARWRREGRRLRPSQVVEIALDTLDVLAAAHAHDVIHGALGLDHVLVSRSGILKLCGFGAVGDFDPGAPSQTIPVDLASYPFVAPEQVRSNAASWTPATDVFGVAAMACTLLMGTFSLDGPPDPFRRGMPTLAAGVAAVLDRAIAFGENARYASAGEMRAALEASVSDAVRVKTGPRLADSERGRGSASGSSAGYPFHDASSDSSPSVPITIESGMPPAASTAKRATTLLAVSALDGPRAVELGERAAAARLRVEMVLDSSALILPSALAGGHEDAYEVAAFALAVARSWPDLPLSIVTGFDVLTENEAPTAIKVALSRVAALGVMPPIRLDAASARIVEPFFRVGRDADGAVLEGELASSSASRRLLGQPTSFVGRESESERLGGVVLRALSGEGARVALVTGSAGLGKSRLVEETMASIRRRVPEVDTWVAAADPIRMDAAFGLVAQLVCHAAGVSRDEPSEERARAVVERVVAAVPAGDVERVGLFMRELCGASADDVQNAELSLARRDAAVMADQMRFAFLDLLSGVTDARPLVIVVEDLQWADAASVSLLGDALALLEVRPWVIVATARTGAGEERPGSWEERSITIELPPLAPSALETMASNASGGRLSQVDIRRLVDTASGNPLLLEETIRAHDEGCYRGTRDLAAVVRERFEALDTRLKRTLSAASVFGSSFSLAGVQALLGASADGPAAGGAAEHPARVASTLEELCQRELVFARPRRRGTTEFAFRHALVREIAYEGLVRERRANAHLAAGTFLELGGERESAVLAEHFSRGNAEVQAAAWYERSATTALERSDVTRALELAERGLAYRPHDDVALSLLAVKAECHAWRAEYERATEAARRVIKSVSYDSLLFARALPTLATGLTRGGDPEGSVMLAELLLSEPSSPTDKRALSASMTTLVSYLLRVGRSDLVRLLMSRLAQMSSEPGADPATLASVESARSWCAMFAGDLAECLQRDREVVRRFAEARDLRSACRETVSIGYDFMVLGAYEEAESALGTALSTATRLGIVGVVGFAKQHLAVVHLRLGRLESAHRYAVEALEIGRASPDPVARGSMRCYLGLVLAARGDDVGAVASLREAIDLFSSTPAIRAYPTAELARILLSEGKLVEALANAETAMDVVAATGPAEEGDAVIRLAHVEALMANGRRDEAMTALGRATRRLLERADRISDAALKDSFLRRVPEHAETLALARASGLST